MATESAPASRQAGAHATGRRNLTTLQLSAAALPAGPDAPAEASRQSAYPRAAWGGGSARTPAAEGQAALDDEIDLLAGADLSVMGLSV